MTKYQKANSTVQKYKGRNLNCAILQEYWMLQTQLCKGTKVVDATNSTVQTEYKVVDAANSTVQKYKVLDAAISISTGMDMDASIVQEYKSCGVLTSEPSELLSVLIARRLNILHFHLCTLDYSVHACRI